MAYTEPSKEEMKKYKKNLKDSFLKDHGKSANNFTDFLVRGMHFLTASLTIALEACEMHDKANKIMELNAEKEADKPLIETVGVADANKIIRSANERTGKQVRR